MNNYKVVVSLFFISLLTACGGPVNIEGDVFLVKGDGKPQPAAAKQVIFIEGESLESILIDAYLSSIEELAEKNSTIIRGLCKNSSNNWIAALDEGQDTIDQAIESAKTNGITDPDGSCSIIDLNAEDSKVIAQAKQNSFLSLINQEQVKIDQATISLSNLNKILNTKISERENELYENFAKGIEITFSYKNATGSNRGKGFKANVIVSNNTQYNIRLNDPIYLETYNVEGDPVGSHYPSGLYECWYSPGSMIQHLEIAPSGINKSFGVDEFGFAKSSFLPTGSSAVASPNNYYCNGKSLTSSQRLKMSKKYGNNESDWPNLDVPDLSKDYKILPNSGRFIPVLPEVRTETGDVVTYESMEVSFRAIAAQQNWAETELIDIEEKIINKARKEIIRIRSQLAKNPLIATMQNDKRAADSCLAHQEEIIAQNETQAFANQKLDSVNSCDVNNLSIMDDLLLTDDLDFEKKYRILEFDYASDASLSAMSIFANAKYKASTNIAGHYVMNELPRGQYIVISSYADNFLEGIFLANEIIDADRSLDLNNSQYFSIPSIRTLIDSFYAQCSYELCTKETLKHSLDLQSIADYYD
jgi:hypothetical protein